MNEVEKAESLALEAVELVDASTSWVVPVFSAFKDLADRSKADAALEAINKAAAEQQVPPKVELIVKSLLGDIDGAMQVAQMLEAPGEAFEMDLLFISDLKALREHPEFIPLMTRLGVTRYWQSEGCIFTVEKIACPTR